MKSISRNLSIGLTVTIISVCLLFFGIYYSVHTYQNTQTMQTLLVEIADRMSGNLGYHMWNVNHDEVATICEIYLSSNRIEMIEIRDENNQVFYQNGQLSENNPFQKQQQIFYNNLLVGTLFISLDSTSIYASQQNSFLMVVMIIIITSVGGVLVIQFMLRKFLSQPIQHLHHQINLIKERNYHVELDEQVNQELVPMTKAMNQLTKILHVRESEIKEYTTKLEQSNEQLRTEIQERKSIQAQLIQSQKMEAIGTLAGGIAHDFNNIIMVITGYSEILKPKFSPQDPIYDEINQIHQAGIKAAALTKQLLAFSRKQLIHPKVVVINQLIHDINKMLTRLLGEDITIELFLEEELKPINIDPGQFEQIVLNIAVNARDAMPTGGTFIVETLMTTVDEQTETHKAYIKSGEYVVISLSDTGIGMPKDIQDKIFEPFYTTKHKFKGTGLGLSTVFGIIKQNKGYVSVYSEMDQGTTFKIYFPVYDGVEQQQIQEDRMIEDFRGNERVLVIDDDDSICKIIAKVLLENGYSVNIVHDHNELNQLLSTQQLQFDVLITDVILPEKSGREIVKHLEGIMPDLKVIFMSGYTDNAIAHHNVIDEGIHFLQKPFQSTELMRKIRQVLN